VQEYFIVVGRPCLTLELLQMVFVGSCVVHTYTQKTGQVECFQDMLDHIFLPLFQVTIDPNCNPMLHHFLRQVVGFDCVDDESKHETGRDTVHAMPPPAEWTSPRSPPYFYWVYYLSANLSSLNQLRQSRGMSTFSFRPHSGEAGDVAHVRRTGALRSSLDQVSAPDHHIIPLSSTFLFACGWPFVLAIT